MGGCAGTSNVEAGMRFGLPVYGTIAHAWIMSFEDEVEAFRAYQRAFPDNAVLLIDTYDTLRAARRIVEAFEPGQISGVRIDSGDLAGLARGVREIFDAAGFTGTKILVSGDLNEWSISELIAAGAPIDAFGVGTDLTTVKDAPALGVVYKLVEVETEHGREFKMKFSEGKATYPGRKQIWRAYDADGIASGDLVALVEESAPDGDARPLLTQVIGDGRRLAPPPNLVELQRRTRQAVETLPNRLRALSSHPEPYTVQFSSRIEAISDELRHKMV